MSNSSPGSGDVRSTVHQPVLLREVLRLLDLQPEFAVVDGTVGAGGHSRKILEQLGPRGLLVGVDRDPMMLQKAAAVLSDPRCRLKHASYADLPDVLQELGIPAVDRILLDLGLSSDQLADESRGFGIQSAGPLDLRFDTTSGRSAWKLLERLDEDQLTQLFEDFGEERFSRNIAREIVARRGNRRIKTAGDLVAAVQAAVPRQFQRTARTHPATRVFQALRIAVNKELEQLQRVLNDVLWQSLKPGGRAIVITFHSLEDRLVKNAFRDKSTWQNLTPKPITPTPAEQRNNPRSRSAKLRGAVKVPPP